MTIAFHSNQLSMRGTEVALFDYAFYNRVILGNDSFVIVPKNGKKLEEVEGKFKKAGLEVRFYDDWADAERILSERKTDLFYAIKAGNADGVVSSVCKTAVHVVFQNKEPHGDVYAYISKWLAEKMMPEKPLFVPHLISLPKAQGDLREELGIPKGATVLGRYGGYETFDLSFAKSSVYQAAKKRKDLYFLFMNTQPITEGWYKSKKIDLVMQRLFRSTGLKNILYLPSTPDLNLKSKFIASCDGMIHARRQGESFGIACGEFSVMNKPVITWKPKGQPHYERNHIEILGDKGIYFEDKEELDGIFRDFKPMPEKDWDAYSKDFSPEVVMNKFKEVFID